MLRDAPRMRDVLGSRAAQGLRHALQVLPVRVGGSSCELLSSFLPPPGLAVLAPGPQLRACPQAGLDTDPAWLSPLAGAPVLRRRAILSLRRGR